MPPTPSRNTVATVFPRATYLTTQSVRHNGIEHPRGSTLKLTIAEGAHLIKHGAASPVGPDTTAAEYNAKIDLAQLKREDLVKHAVDIYRLDVPTESTSEAIIEAIAAQRAAYAELV